MLKIIFPFLIFIVSLAALLYGASLVTKSASHFARVLGASEFIIGATVVAAGTSLPELTSSIVATTNGLTEIVAGNVIGSNIANIALILGLTGIFYVLETKNSLLRHDVSFFIISALSTLIVFVDFNVTASEGIFLVLVFILYLSNTFHIHRKHGKHIKESLNLKMIPVFILGILGLVLGARYLISSSATIMESIGVSEAIIGFLLIAIGTSLPELATSMVAAKQGKVDMILGDIIGSNIFNSLIVLGISSFFGKLVASPSFINTSATLMVILSFLMIHIVYDKKITRLEGSVLVFIYLIAVALVI